MMEKIVSNPKYAPILAWAQVPDSERTDVMKIRHLISIKAASNLAKMQGMSNAPQRPDMPQLDHPSIGGAQALRKIKSRIATGRLNVEPPFKKGDPPKAAQ